jgi:hypothetical protein
MHSSSPASGQTEVESVLWYAAAVLADAAHHDAETLRTACLRIEAHSTDQTLIAAARHMRALIVGSQT